MALVVLLRGVNVGGHRTFRPTVLARQLEHLGTVNIGAAGTFVIHRPISRTELRAELARRLPFDTEILICRGREVLDLMSLAPFAGRSPGRDLVRFVSVLSRRPSVSPPTPARFPSQGQWLLKILGRHGRFVFGLYRRHPRVITHLGRVDRLFGARATTRNWNTFAAIERALRARG